MHSWVNIDCLVCLFVCLPENAQLQDQWGQSLTRVICQDKDMIFQMHSVMTLPASVKACWHSKALFPFKFLPAHLAMYMYSKHTHILKLFVLKLLLVLFSWWGFSFWELPPHNKTRTLPQKWFHRTMNIKNHCWKDFAIPLIQQFISSMWSDFPTWLICG